MSLETNQTNNLTKHEKWLNRFVIVCAIIGIVAFIVSFFLFSNAENFNKSQKINSDKFGNLGSFISGIIGTLSSFVGVILFYLTLRIQRKELFYQREELSLQRKELQLTRQELKGQKDQMIEQNKTLVLQRFENTFFQLLRTQNDIVSFFNLKHVKIEGRECFDFLYNQLKIKIQFYKYDSHELNDVKSYPVELTLEAYSEFYYDFESILGHYFRNLYNIIKYVHNSEITDKKNYTNIIRSQLSNYELVILFYNGLSEFGIKKFKPLIEEYELLKNMNTEKIFNNEHIKEYEHLKKIHEIETNEVP